MTRICDLTPAPLLAKERDEAKRKGEVDLLHLP